MTMTDKAYIVVNKKQELDILKKFERKGLVWANGETPTDWITSETDLFNYFVSFPYALLEEEVVSWRNMNELTDETIVYDGRKEEKMYKVTQVFMDELIKWRDEYTKSVFGVNSVSLNNMPEIVRSWRFEYKSSIETNKRFGAIVNWINGEYVFEVEAPRKFVVRSDKSYTDGTYAYVIVDSGVSGKSYYDVSLATKFDTREEAQEWANSHQLVVEIDEDGNEVD